MNLFNLSDVGMEFGERILFQNVSFTIGETDKIGLIGGNGTGKTTLFKILLGQMQATSGEVFQNKQTSIGYLEQHTNLTSDKTVLEEVLSVYDDVMAIEEELSEIARKIEEKRGDLSALTERQHKLTERYQARDGYTYKSRAKSSLLGLGFSEAELLVPFSQLSGGQKTRVSLCKLLLSGANLLLLDEPTNHLDLAAVEWLENFLRDYRGAFCVISHDRYFLDKIANRIFALEYRKITVYEGNYSRYLTQKAEREKSVLRHYENTQREIKRLEGVVRQQRQWNREKNIKTAESKLKAIARLEEGLEAPESEAPSIHFKLSAKPGGGQDVLILDNVSMGFAEKHLFSGANLTVRKGNKMFLLGANGCGKTTLFKLITGVFEPTGGMIRLGANIAVGSEVVLVILCHIGKLCVRLVCRNRDILIDLVVSGNYGYIGIRRIYLNNVHNLSACSVSIVKYDLGLNCSSGNKNVIFFRDYIVIAVSTKLITIINHIVICPILN